MREPIRILNEEQKLHTFACCECHPDEVSETQYDTFKYKSQDSIITYQASYCSYIALNLVTPKRVTFLIEFLKRMGFTEDNRPVQSLVDKIDDDTVTLVDYYCLHVEIPTGILNFLYSCYKKGEPADGRISIEVVPFEGQRIREWREWDNIRDTGWEYWLEILYRFTN